MSTARPSGAQDERSRALPERILPECASLADRRLEGRARRADFPRPARPHHFHTPPTTQASTSTASGFPEPFGPMTQRPPARKRKPSARRTPPTRPRQNPRIVNVFTGTTPPQPSAPAQRVSGRRHSFPSLDRERLFTLFYCFRQLLVQPLTEAKWSASMKSRIMRIMRHAS